MSASQAPTGYSIDDGDEDLRTAFDEEFDWEDEEYRTEVTAHYCDKSTSTACHWSCC